MTSNRRTLWLVVTCVSLSAFSFAAGFGIRGLATMLSRGPLSSSLSARLATGTRVASAAPGAGEPDLRPAELYKDVYNKLHLFYVEPLPSDTKLAEGSVEAMLASLDDPNTRLLTAREWQALQDLSQGSVHGLGAVLTIRKYKDGDREAERNITVVSVLPGSAAEKAGLQPGDRITFLDGKWIAPMHLNYRQIAQIEDSVGPHDFGRPPREGDNPEAPSATEREKRRKEVEELRRRWLKATDLNDALETLMAGRPGEHELSVQRAGAEKPVTMKVQLADSQAKAFEARKLNPTTGYVRILLINGDTPRELETALAGFKRDGAHNLIVDLRSSPGGLLEATKEVLAQLAPGSTLALAKVRDARHKLVDQKIVARGGGDASYRPAAVSVLVDRGTAGSSEVLAAALRDNLGARLVGANTFGDGTEQQVVPLPNGAAVTITHAQLRSPKGTEIEGKGLKPDLPGGPGDAGIEAALSALKSPPASAAVTPAGRRPANAGRR